MAGRSHWSHAGWKHDDASRFYVTLGVSVLLHAVLLLAWKLPAPLWKAADQAVLTVVLRGAAPLAPTTPAAAAKKTGVPVLLRKDPAASAFSVPPKSAQGAMAPPMARPQSVLSASSARIAPVPIPGRLSNSTPAAVGVTVKLVISGDGRVQQIFWDSLPALTDEQLRRVEAAIRDKIYAGGQTINEIFDVRGFLKLPQVRSEESALPYQPAVE
ncbi:MAG: hypothetical protein A3H93_07775 [Rhodocyclales bacterium RIFCSPLOWO2_02_FULL_63_24]|nr:MAG: hypothetical protein A3H93_07775 [Rhodocyclales bacterium RIFCSPLOWO2_02_FULL_63_24]